MRPRSIGTAQSCADAVCLTNTNILLESCASRYEIPKIEKSLAEAEAIYREKTADFERKQTDGAAPGMLYIAEMEAKWSARLLEATRTGQRPKIEGVVQAIRLDDIAILTAPGEAFVQLGLDAKHRSPLPHTLFASYANGGAGYIPTAEASIKPGQRVVTPDGITHKVALTTPPAPEFGTLVVDTGLELLQGLIDAER